MIYPYIVVKDGVWYESGADVPDSSNVAPIKEVQEVVDTDHHYTKTEIQRLSTSELQKLAKSEGIEDASDKNGSQLKKILIEHFDL